MKRKMQQRRTELVLIFGSVLLLAIFFKLAHNGGDPTVSSGGNQVALAKGTYYSPASKDSLVYPGASFVKSVDVSSQRPHPFASHDIYEVMRSPREILAYYRDTLPIEGWQLTNADATPSSPTFVRLEKDEGISWNTSLNIALEVFEDGSTGIHLLLNRFPDISNIPVYPDAQVVQRDSTIDSVQQTMTNTTHYRTQAPIAEIAKYYEANLRSYAWVDFRNTDTPSTDLRYGYNDFGPPYLTIHLTSISDSVSDFIVVLTQSVAK